MDCQSIADGVLLCEPTYGFWLQTGAIIVSAFAAIGLIYYTQSVAKKRATIDLVLQQKLDKELLEAEKFFYAHQRAGGSFTAFACNPNAPENRLIQAILNNHEFAASGIKDRAFCEKTYKRMLCSVVVKDWIALKPYVTELRNKEHKTLFQEFEWLADRWTAKPLKAIK